MITLQIAQQYLKLTTTLDENNFLPFVADAVERYLRPFLGDDLIILLETLVDGTILEDDRTRIDALKEKVDGPLSRFTFLLAAPSLDINVGQQGFTTAGSTTMVPASEARVKRFTESIERLGWDGIEVLLRFLEINKDTYPEWTSSEAYTSFTQGYIRSAEQFNKYVDIDSSRLKFYRLRQAMNLVETLQVEPLLSTLLFDNLKEENIAGNTYSTNRTKAFELACKFIALQSAAEEIDNKYRAPAGHVFNILRDHLNANPGDFVELFPNDDTATSRAPYSSYENAEDSPIFEFGGGCIL